MEQVNLIQDATVVMLIGMGVVFMFLIVMVCVMNIMTPIMAFLNKIFPEQVLESIDKPKKNLGNQDEEIAAAIAIALSR